MAGSLDRANTLVSFQLGKQRDQFGAQIRIRIKHHVPREKRLRGNALGKDDLVVVAHDVMIRHKANRELVDRVAVDQVLGGNKDFVLPKE